MTIKSAAIRERKVFCLDSELIITIQEFKISDFPIFFGGEKRFPASLCDLYFYVG